MNIKFLENIAKESPRFARIVAISFYWALFSILTYIWASLENGDWTQRKVAIGAFVTVFSTWVIEGLQKKVRDKKRVLESNK